MRQQLSPTCIKASMKYLCNKCCGSLLLVFCGSDVFERICLVPSESAEARQRSYDLGIHLGYQRRNKDVIAWVKKRRRTIRREDLISFLCGKVPPPRTSRAPPRVASRAPPPETDGSVETDLQPFREAIALQGTSKRCIFGRNWFNMRIRLHQPGCLFPFQVLAVPWRVFLCALVLLVPQRTLLSP